MATQPVLFIGHGSPMNAVEDNAWSRAWRDLGTRLTKPSAILCVSAHWQTPGVLLGAAEQPRTIHDFGGFPPALYRIEYPAPGDPALAARVAGMLDPALDPQLDADYGLDHGAWQVLLHLFPEADVPVVQLSLDLRRPGPQHFAIGRMLAPLRDEGVLLIGSGLSYHNLRAFGPAALGASSAFDQWLRTIMALPVAEREAALRHWEQAPAARLAHPREEHLLPLMVAAGAAPDEVGELVYHEDRFMGGVTASSFRLGAPARQAPAAA